MKVNLVGSKQSYCNNNEDYLLAHPVYGPCVAYVVHASMLLHDRWHYRPLELH